MRYGFWGFGLQRNLWLWFRLLRPPLRFGAHRNKAVRTAPAHPAARGLYGCFQNAFTATSLKGDVAVKITLQVEKPLAFISAPAR